MLQMLLNGTENRNILTPNRRAAMRKGGGRKMVEDKKRAKGLIRTVTGELL